MGYDRIVIGNGRDALDAAKHESRQNRRVALVRTSEAGWEQTMPWLLRQAAERLIWTSAPMAAWQDVIVREVAYRRSVDLAELLQLNVDLVTGPVQIRDVHTVQVGSSRVTGEALILACGTQSVPLAQAPFDGVRILSVEQLPALTDLPESVIVAGAGKTGLEHATVLAMLGVNVTVVDEHPDVLDLCNGLMSATLIDAQSLGIAFRLGDEVIGVEQPAGKSKIAVRLASGRGLSADAVLVCIGRQGCTAGLDLEAAGVGLDERGRIWCDARGQTWTANITAVGDVIGYRALAG